MPLPMRRCRRRSCSSGAPLSADYSSFGVIEGPFLSVADYSGDHDGEAAFAVTLASAGALSHGA